MCATVNHLLEARKELTVRAVGLFIGCGVCNNRVARISSALKI
jgi:hypothetical protein